MKAPAHSGMPAVSSAFSTCIHLLPSALCLLITVLCSAAAPSDLRIIATNGTTVGGARLTTIRPGVSIENLGTIDTCSSVTQSNPSDSVWIIGRTT